MQIIVNVKNVYGKESVYPVCETAKILASIAGTQTLTAETMRKIESLGYRILIEQPKRVWA